MVLSFVSNPQPLDLIYSNGRISRDNDLEEIN